MSERDDRLLRGTAEVLDGVGRELERVRTQPRRLDADAEQVGRCLAQLVLTIVDLLRQLMERQALRLMEQGSLDEAEIERLGLTFMRLAERMEQLKGEFELADADLNLDLGPLGSLL